jgi:hypothetical protein
MAGILVDDGIDRAANQETSSVPACTSQHYDVDGGWV